MRELHLRADIEAIQVRNEEEANQYGFLGSPTIQVDGQDIEVSRRTDKTSFSCRVYRTQKGISGVPPKDLLLEAFKKVQRGSP